MIIERRFLMSKKEEVELITREQKGIGSIKTNPAYFFQRLAAYLIDIVLVSIVVSLITFPIPKNENLEKINQEIMNINQEYMEGEIEIEEYINKSIGVSRDAAYENVWYTIVEITVIILYFIVFQFYNKGQTLGKKLLHIRVVKNNDTDLTMNDLIFRGLIFPAVLVDMLILGMTLFANDTVYFYTSNVLTVVQGLVLIAILIMICSRKDGRGLHDLVANTRVIMEK